MKPRTAATIGSRAFEGFVGSALGGAMGGVVGAAAYEPAKPRQWADMYGNIYSRPLTPEERKTRLQIAAAAALAGALGGAGLSVGGSKLLRARVAAIEREAAQGVANDFLDPLRELIGDWTSRRNAVQTGLPQGAPRYKGLDKRIEKARVLLRKQEKQVKNLVDEADARRSALPFIGGLTDQSKSLVGYDWATMSHAGVAKQHFDMFAKEHGYKKGMNHDNVYRIFNDAVEKAMTKTSRAAFHDELRKIAFQFRSARGAQTGVLNLASRGTGGFVGRPARSGSFAAPVAASVDAATGKAGPVQTSMLAKARNMVQPQQQLPPVQVSKPPTPDPTPGGV